MGNASRRVNDNDFCCQSPFVRFRAQDRCWPKQRGFPGTFQLDTPTGFRLRSTQIPVPTKSDGSIAKEVNMKLRFAMTWIFAASILWASALWAQDLGPGFTKVKDGIYTFAPDATTTTCSFVVTQEGVVMIDSCNSPLDSRRMVAAIKKVTDKPVVFLIDTETHSDHTANHFVFSPPATVINHL